MEEESAQFSVQELFQHKIDESTEYLSTAFADAVSEEEQGKPSLVPPQPHREYLKQQFKAVLNKGKQTFEQGANVVFETLQYLAEHGESEEERLLLSDMLQGDFLTFIEGCAYYVVHPEQARTAMEGGKSIATICGMSETTLRGLYHAAKYVYEQKRYEEASQAFTFLLYINATVPFFWLCLGNAEFYCKRYESALVAYSRAIILDPMDMSAYLYGVKCLENLGQIEQACQLLDAALMALDASQDEKKQEWKTQIERERVRLSSLLPTYLSGGGV